MHGCHCGGIRSVIGIAACVVDDTSAEYDSDGSGHAENDYAKNGCVPTAHGTRTGLRHGCSSIACEARIWL